MTRRGGTAGLAAGLTAVLLAGLLTGCSGGEESAPARTAPGDDASATGATTSAAASDTAIDPDDPALDVALSEPQEDSYYPSVGDPGVDALHYRLDLAWTPRTRTLDARESLVFRSTTDAEQFQLDLGEELTVSSVEVDGEAVEFEERGKDLVVLTQVVTDERYTVDLAYSGTPRPVAAPTTRSDFDSTGWTVTEDGETWTMQEPFGAYTWYAVNDHPSDKALYDFTLSVPEPWTGVANGELVSSVVDDEGNRVTTFHLDEPAAPYLVTVANGSFEMSGGRSESGVPFTYWTPTGDRVAARRVRAAHRELAWVEEKLGPYPFSSLGIVVVDSRSGMETQTMITLGNTDYTLSPEVVVHEIVHQWWGNQVTPDDWTDLWMSEGMAMYLQYLWQAERDAVPVEQLMSDWAGYQQQSRADLGPPADYDPAMFGEGNVYHVPALMWHELRGRLGDEEFWRLASAWPAEHDNENAGYDEITAWWSERSGRDLQAFFDSWLLSDTGPAVAP